MVYGLSHHRRGVPSLYTSLPLGLNRGLGMLYLVLCLTCRRVFSIGGFDPTKTMVVQNKECYG